MGMFDEVNLTCECPKCGKEVGGFQTKDLRCTLMTVSPIRPDNYYSKCDNCKNWIEFDAVEPRIKDNLTRKYFIYAGKSPMLFEMDYIGWVVVEDRPEDVTIKEEDLYSKDMLSEDFIKEFKQL